MLPESQRNGALERPPSPAHFREDRLLGGGSQDSLAVQTNPEAAAPQVALLLTLHTRQVPLPLGPQVLGLQKEGQAGPCGPTSCETQPCSFRFLWIILVVWTSPMLQCLRADPASSPGSSSDLGQVPNTWSQPSGHVCQWRSMAAPRLLAKPQGMSVATLGARRRMNPGEDFLSCRRGSGLRWGEPLSLSWAPSKFRSSF